MRVYVRSCNENSLHYTLYADLAEDDVVTGVSINLKPRLSFKDEFPFYTEYWRHRFFREFREHTAGYDLCWFKCSYKPDSRRI